MKEELDLEEKTDVELVGVPTEEAAGSPGAEEAEPGGGLSEGDGVVPGDEEKAGPGELSPIKAFTESEWTNVLTCLYARYWVGISLRPGGCVARWD